MARALTIQNTKKQDVHQAVSFLEIRKGAGELAILNRQRQPLLIHSECQTEDYFSSSSSTTS